MTSAPEIGEKLGSGLVLGDIDPGSRSANRVNSVSFLGLDIDKAAPPFDEVVARLKEAGLKAIIHTTYSHTPDAPRFRLFFDLSRRITQAEVKALPDGNLSFLQEAIASRLGLVKDEQTKDASRLFFLPRVSGESGRAEFRHATSQGEPIDVDQFMAQGQAERSAQERYATNTKAKREPLTQGPSSIDAFNARYTLADILERNGYRRKGKRYLCPDSTSGVPGVNILSGERVCYSHHNSDPLADGEVHDSFDCFRILEHGKEWNQAIRAAAREFGIERQEGTSPAQFDGMIPGASGNVGLRRFKPHTFGEGPFCRRMIIPRFIYHGLSVIAGARGVGKTTALLPLAMKVAGIHKPRDPLGPSHWRHVVWVSEDTVQQDAIIQAMIKCGGFREFEDLIKERVHLHEARRLNPGDVATHGPEWLQKWTRSWLEPLATKREQANLSFLTEDLYKGIPDPLPVALPPLIVLDTAPASLEIEEENSNSDWSRAIAALKDGFSGAPLWIVAHISKGTQKDPTARGASSIEGDAQQVLYLVNPDAPNRKGVHRELQRGKTRGAGIPGGMAEKIQITVHTATDYQVNEFGNVVSVSMEWSESELIEQGSMIDEAPKDANARKAERQAQEQEQLKQKIVDAFREAESKGTPLTKSSIKAKVTGSAGATHAAVESLLDEKWLFLVEVPKELRTNSNRKEFVTVLTEEEREALIEKGTQPTREIPPSWRKTISEPAETDEQPEGDPGGVEEGRANTPDGDDEGM